MQATDMPAFSNVLSIPTTHTHGEFSGGQATEDSIRPRKSGV